MTNWYDDLSAHARKVHSQTGEEGIIEAIFAAIGTTHRFLVDLGAGDGLALSNTALLLAQGWQGARFDLRDHADVHGVRLTAENVCALLQQHKVPDDFDLLSIDLDSIDWYVLRAVLREYRPRVFICEINGHVPPYPPVAVAYDPSLVFANSDYFGASFGAYVMLAMTHGYTPICNHLGLNLFCVRSELLPPNARPSVVHIDHRGWPADPARRPWVTLTEEDCR